MRLFVAPMVQLKARLRESVARLCCMPAAGQADIQSKSSEPKSGVLDVVVRDLQLVAKCRQPAQLSRVRKDPRVSYPFVDVIKLATA